MHTKAETKMGDFSRFRLAGGSSTLVTIINGKHSVLFMQHRAGPLLLLASYSRMKNNNTAVER